MSVWSRSICCETGTRVLAVPFDRVPEGHRSAYAVCARRGWKPFEIEYYRIPLRERLPAIRIPLRRDDSDVALDLQTLIDECYESGRYGDDIDYREEPEPASWRRRCQVGGGPAPRARAEVRRRRSPLPKRSYQSRESRPLALSIRRLIEKRAVPGPCQYASSSKSGAVTGFSLAAKGAISTVTLTV